MEKILTGYSVILKTSFYEMNQKIGKILIKKKTNKQKRKKLIFKISVDSIFLFTS